MSRKRQIEHVYEFIYLPHIGLLGLRKIFKCWWTFFAMNNTPMNFFFFLSSTGLCSAVTSSPRWCPDYHQKSFPCPQISYLWSPWLTGIFSVCFILCYHNYLSDMPFSFVLDECYSRTLLLLATWLLIMLMSVSDHNINNLISISLIANATTLLHVKYTDIVGKMLEHPRYGRSSNIWSSYCSFTVLKSITTAWLLTIWWFV